MTDPERLLDLDGEAGEEIAERVLQGEADDHGADRRGGQQLLVEEQRRRHGEQADDDDVLDDGRHAFGRPIPSPRIDEQRDAGDEAGGDEGQPRHPAEQRRVAQPAADADLDGGRRREQHRREHQTGAQEPATHGSERHQHDAQRDDDDEGKLHRRIVARWSLAASRQPLFGITSVPPPS